jgi:hypothetical protein
MSIILKRPMFRKGGSVAEGTGITSGLTHRKRFADGSDNPMRIPNFENNTLPEEVIKKMKTTPRIMKHYLSNVDDYLNDFLKNFQPRPATIEDILQDSSKEPFSMATGGSVADELAPKRGLVNQIGGYAGENTDDEDNTIATLNDDTNTTPFSYDNTDIIKALPVSTTKKERVMGENLTDQEASDLMKKVNEQNEKSDREYVKQKQTEVEAKKEEPKTTVKNIQKQAPKTTTSEDEDLKAVKKLQEKEYNPNAIYNSQGQDISQSIMNIANITKQAMQPSDGFSNFLGYFAGAGGNEPLALKTWGSVLGQAAGEQAKARAKQQEEISKYVGTVLGRGISTLGKGATGAGGTGVLAGNMKKAFPEVSVDLKRTYPSLAAALNSGDDEFINALKERAAYYDTLTQNIPWAQKEAQKILVKGAELSQKNQRNPNLASGITQAQLNQDIENNNLSKYQGSKGLTKEQIGKKIVFGPIEGAGWKKNPDGSWSVTDPNVANVDVSPDGTHTPGMSYYNPRDNRFYDLKVDKKTGAATFVPRP